MMRLHLPLDAASPSSAWRPALLLLGVLVFGAGASALGGCALLGAGERAADGPPVRISFVNGTDEEREVVLALKPLESQARPVIERRKVLAGRELWLDVPSPPAPFIIELRDDRSFSPWSTVVEEAPEGGFALQVSMASSGLVVAPRVSQSSTR